jgi:hypothetical protein
MDPARRALWQKLRAFPIDSPGTALRFVDRLARENGWRPAHAEAVLLEYRRFLLLAASAGHPVTPSDAVDQAWHLHLSYTQSYWDDLCGRILRRPLHHGPTRGGRAEARKFRDWYAATLRSYRTLFGHEAPAAIWPPPAQRFAPADFRRIDVSRSWLLPRLGAPRGAAAPAAVLAGGAAAGCAWLGLPEGRDPAVWALAAGTGLFAILLMRAVRRSRPRSRQRKREEGSSGCAPYTAGGAGASGGRSSVDRAEAASGCGGAEAGVGDAATGAGDGGGGDGGSGCGSGCGSG